jgi:hypothetical protein
MQTWRVDRFEESQEAGKEKQRGAVSDVTLRDLPAEETFLAMQKEICGLTAVGAGCGKRKSPMHHWHEVGSRKTLMEGVRMVPVGKAMVSRSFLNSPLDVDVLLVATTSESALKTLMTALSAHVKLRETGRLV